MVRAASTITEPKVVPPAPTPPKAPPVKTPMRQAKSGENQGGGGEVPPAGIGTVAGLPRPRQATEGAGGKGGMASRSTSDSEDGDEESDVEGPLELQ